MSAYLLCASPRSGSTLLCSMLRQAGAGKPHSYFRVASIRDWSDWWGLPPADPATYGTAYIEKAIATGKDETDVFGLRSMWDSMPPLLARLNDMFGLADDLTHLTNVFGPLRFIHLSRQDMVAQAVSLARAEQSGLWHRRADGSILEQTKDPEPPAYDRDAIASELASLQADTAGWANWFAQTGITPHRLSYEDLAANPQDAFARVLAHIGMYPAIARNVEPGTAKLADDVSRDWCRRFRADMGLA